MPDDLRPNTPLTGRLAPLPPRGDPTLPPGLSPNVDAKHSFLHNRFRRMLVPVWILGVLDVSAAVIYAEHITPRWVWAWLIFLAVWFVIGAVVLIFETIKSPN